MARVRPKYPRRGKASRIWFPALGLLFLGLAVGSAFYCCTREDRQVERAVERLSDSLTARSSRAADGRDADGSLFPGTAAPSTGRSAPRRDAPERGAPAPPAPPRVSPEPPALEQGALERGAFNASAPSLPYSPGHERNQTALRPQDSSPVGASTGTPQGTPPPSDGDALPEKAAATEQSREAPFAGLTLGRIASEFAATYGNMKPVHWGERLPGVTWRLDASGTLPSGGEASGKDAAGRGASDKGAFASFGQGSPVPASTHPAGAGKPVLALTLDACDGRKGSGYDAGIIALLREKNIPATIFVTSIWMRNNPETLRELAADPLFEIAAHGTRHRPCSVNGRSVYGIKGTASFAELVQEVEGNVRDIQAATGKRPRWFRSGTAYYDDVAVRVIRDLELGMAGYSVAGDEGASLSAARVAAKTLAAKDGDILLYHLNRPRSGTRAGLERALPALLEKGFVFVRLSPGAE